MVFSRSLKMILINLLVSSAMLISVSYANTEYRVKSTDNLSGIVGKFYKDSQLSRSQIFIGILAENPHAFRFGNINYLKNKQLLNIPNSDDLLAMEKEDAASLVAEHNRHTKKRKKVQLDPPFEGYTPKNPSTESSQISDIAKIQQDTSQEIERLRTETEELRLRLKKLTEDKTAMDSELNQLDTLLTQ